MGPVFDQGWSLFAPVPKVNKNVYVSYSDSNGNWSDWNDPFSFYQYQAYTNRVSACQRIVLAESSTLHYLYAESEITFYKTKMFPGNIHSGYFSVLKHIVVQELNNRKTAFEKIKMMVVFTNVKTKQKYCLYYHAFESQK